MEDVETYYRLYGKENKDAYYVSIFEAVSGQIIAVKCSTRKWLLDRSQGPSFCQRIKDKEKGGLLWNN